MALAEQGERDEPQRRELEDLRKTLGLVEAPGEAQASAQERQRWEALRAEKEAAEAEAERALDVARLVLAQTQGERPGVMVSLLRQVAHPERTPGWWQAAFDLLSHPIPDISLMQRVVRFALSKDGARALVIVEGLTPGAGFASKIVLLPGLEVLYERSFGVGESPSVESLSPSGGLWCGAWRDGRIECVEVDSGETRSWRVEGRPDGVSFRGVDRVAVWASLERGRRCTVFSVADPSLCLEGPLSLGPPGFGLDEDGHRFVAQQMGAPSMLGVLGASERVEVKTDLRVWDSVGFVEALGLVLLVDVDRRVQAVDLKTGAPVFELDRVYTWVVRGGVLFLAGRGGLFTPKRGGAMRCLIRARQPWVKAWLHAQSQHVVVVEERTATAVMFELKASARQEPIVGLAGDIVEAQFDPGPGAWVLQSDDMELAVIRGAAPRVAVKVPSPPSGVSLQAWALSGGRLLGVSRANELFGARLEALCPRSLSQSDRLEAWSADGATRVCRRGFVWSGIKHSRRVLLRRDWSPDAYEVSADGSFVLGVRRSPGAFCLWRAQDGARLQSWEAAGGVAHAASLSLDTRWVVQLDAGGLQLEPLAGSGDPRRFPSLRGSGALDFFAPERLRVLLEGGSLWELEVVAGVPVLLAEDVGEHRSRPEGGLLVLDRDGALWAWSPERRRLDVGSAEVTSLASHGALVAWADADGGLWVLRGGDRTRLRERGERITELSFKDDRHLVVLEGGASVRHPGEASLWDTENPGRSVVLHRAASGARGLPGGEVLVELAGLWFPAPQQLFPASLSIEALRRALEVAPAWSLPASISRLLDP